MKRTHGSAVCRSWPWTWAVGLSVGLLLGAWTAQAQDQDGRRAEVFTNEDLIKLLDAGFEDEIILLKIDKTKHVAFDSGVDELVKLKEHGGSVAIIQVVILRAYQEGTHLRTKVQIQVQRMRSPEPEQYKDALRQLREMQPQKRVAFILTGELASTSDVVRARVCEALGLLGSPTVLPALMRKLNDRTPGVRSQAARAISRLRQPDTYKAVTELLKDPIMLHRDGVCFTLGYMREKRAVPLLLDLLQENTQTSENRGAAAYALGLLSDRSARVYRALIRAVTTDQFPEVRANASWALCKLGAGGDARELKEILSALRKAFDRYPVNRVDILENIRIFRDGRAIRVMIDALRDSSMAVKRGAWVGLKELTGENHKMDYDEWQAWWTIRGHIRFPITEPRKEKKQLDIEIGLGLGLEPLPAAPRAATGEQ